MVWSSARAHSVEAMLGHSFGKKVLTIKDLEFVWDAIKKEKKEAEASGTIDEKFLLDYDQTNTVLIDDSTDKIQLQPHNGLTLLDFDEALAKSGTDSELLRVMDYLEKLVYQDNVSAYIRANPFNKGKEVDSDGSAVGNKAKENESQDTVEALTASMEKSTIS
ncbi:hypothetical protein BGZ76_009449 [Entomortierella beljakovae]|nr:hypothetical protein BGZ76_009449 [Entomortierella beljakovae]